MAEQYRQLRMPLTAYQKFILKRNKMEDKLFSLNRKPTRIPLTKLMKMLADRELVVEDEELVQKFGRKKRNGFQ